MKRNNFKLALSLFVVTFLYGHMILYHNLAQSAKEEESSVQEDSEDAITIFLVACKHPEKIDDLVG